MRESNRKAVIEFLFKDTFFKELFDSELSDAKFKPLRLLGLDTLEKLLSLSRENALKINYIGRKTYRALRELQEHYNEVVNGISNSKALRFKDFKWVLKRNQRILDIFSRGKIMDGDAPFPSLSQWILENSWQSERNRRVFMCRMGMLGEPQMTYDQIGIQHGITKERVRQIILKVQSNGRHPLQRIRLDPLISEAARIVKTGGESMGISALTERLLNRGPQGALLKHAQPFMEYVASFPEWREAIG